MAYRVSNRDCCRICSSKDLHILITLNQMPLTDEFISKSEDIQGEFLADIKIYFCKVCKVVQTLHDVEVVDYYEDYQYSVGNSKKAKAFMREIAYNLVNLFPPEKKIKVLEIGSGDGGQLLEFKNLGCDVLGFEPSENLVQIAQSKGIESIKGLFSEKTVKVLPQSNSKFNIVFLSYTFDHLPEPKIFLRTVRRILESNEGLLAIEVHDIEKIFTQKEYCLFEHEHSVYLNEATAYSVLKENGFNIIDFNIVPISSRRANSLIFIASNNTSAKFPKRIKAKSQNNFLDFSFLKDQVKKVKTNLKNIEQYIENETNNGKRIAGYGAGGRGVMTLALLNNADKLTYLIDKNPKGKNLFTPKSRLPVFNIEKLNDDKVDEIIVFSYGYIDEIFEDIRKFGYSRKQLHAFPDLMESNQK